MLARALSQAVVRLANLEVLVAAFAGEPGWSIWRDHPPIPLLVRATPLPARRPLPDRRDLSSSARHDHVRRLPSKRAEWDRDCPLARGGYRSAARIPSSKAPVAWTRPIIAANANGIPISHRAAAVSTFIVRR